MTDQLIEKFTTWVKENGGTFSKFEFKNDANGVGGVYASESVTEGEIMATLPFRLAITEKVARSAFPELKNVSGRAITSLFLVKEKLLGDQSFYAPYIRILPSRIITPFLYDDNDMKLLRNTNLEKSVKDKMAALETEFKELLKQLPADERSQITWDDFLWAYSVFSSRAFPYSLIDPAYEGSSEVLFPLLDSLNHKPNTKITWERSGDENTGSIKFISGQPYASGDQLYNNYGPKSNEELLLGYGFCFEENEFDHVALKPNFSMDAHRDSKLQIMRQCSVVSGNDDPLVYYIHRNHIPDHFFKMMRVLVMNSLEVSYYTTCSEIGLLSFVGYRNELSMLMMTQNLLQGRLMALDNLDIDRSKVTWWQAYALMYRDGQRDVLSHALATIDNKKRNLLAKMTHCLQQGILAPKAPFLSIVNADFFKHDMQEESMTDVGFIPLELTVISLKQLLTNDAQFKKAMKSLFEDLEEEEDVALMVALIRERSKGEKSKWHLFFDRLGNPTTNMEGDVMEDLQQLYESLFPAFSEAFPDMFDPEVYSFESFVWAEYIITNLSISNPLAIVPM